MFSVPLFYYDHGVFYTTGFVLLFEVYGVVRICFLYFE